MRTKAVIEVTIERSADLYDVLGDIRRLPGVAGVKVESIPSVVSR